MIKNYYFFHSLFLNILFFFRILFIIEQQGSKKFALTYDYDDKHYILIVIAIKDKFINIVTQHIFNKKGEKMNKGIMLYHYDWEEDILYFHTKKKYKYEVSEFVTKMVTIELSDNKFPIGIEILDASKVLNIKKNLIKNIKGGEIDIKINDIVQVKISLEIPLDKEASSQPINVVGDDKSLIPDIEAGFAISLA